MMEPLTDLPFDSVIDILKFTDTPVAVDTECDPETDTVLGISMACESYADYLPVADSEVTNLKPKHLTTLLDILHNKTLVFHNAGFDILKLEPLGFIESNVWYDTMLMAHWIDENKLSYSLDSVSREYGGLPKNRSKIMQLIIDTDGWVAVPYKLIREYSTNDAFITLELFNKLLPLFQAQEFDTDIWHKIECKFILIIARMVQQGVKIDLDFCMREILRGESIMQDCREQLNCNPASPKDLEHLLLNTLALPVAKKTPGGKVSFDKEAMEQYETKLKQIKSPVADLVLTYRGWQKTLSANYKSYISHCDNNHILHPNYMLHRTVTSRLSCSEPALQQIPKISEKDWNGNLKSAFIPREGYQLWSADYSQLEFRLVAAYAEEEQLLEIFKDDSRSLFKEMSNQLDWDYNKTKTFSYATIYGSGANHTSQIFNVSMNEAKEMIDEFYSTYPGIKKVTRQASYLARKRGWVQLWTGRRRHFRYKGEDFKAMNAIAQGGGAEIVKRAMIRLAESVCNDLCRMLLQIHDEVIFEIATGREKEYLPHIKQVMEEIDYDFGIPFKVEITKWGEK